MSASGGIVHHRERKRQTRRGTALLGIGRLFPAACAIVLGAAIVVPACRSNRPDDCNRGACIDGGHDGSPPVVDAGATIDGPDDGARNPPGALGECENGWCWQSPLPQGNDFYAIVALAPNDAWALGTTSHHYDGVGWAPKGSLPRGSKIRAAWAASANSIWAVGDSDLILHWDGVAWSQRATGLGALAANLGAIWGASDADIFVGGVDGVGHWDGASWTRIPLVGLDVTHTIQGLAGSSPNDVWATSLARRFHYSGGGSFVETFDKPGDTFAQPGGEAVWARAANDVWFSELPTPAFSGNTQVQHWDGVAFSSMAQSVNNTHQGASIIAFWGAGPKDVWAAPSDIPRAVADVLHFDGTWKRVALPRCADCEGGLFALGGTSATDIWGVGGGGLITHYDGVAWTSHTTSLTRRDFDAVWGTSPTDVWAVSGQAAPAWVAGTVPTTIAHFDGSTWKTSVVPTKWPLNAIWGTSRTSAWAAGGLGRTPPTPDAVVLRWNGAVWTTESTGLAGDIHGLWGSSESDVWAVGDSAPCPGKSETPCGAILHFNGATWSQALVGREYEYIRAIWGFAANDVWAVGETQAAGLIRHWDGTTWSVVAEHSSRHYQAIWGASPNDIWVGGHGGGSGLLQHFDGVTWTETIFAKNSTYMGVFGRASNDVWAVGGDVIHWDGSKWTEFSPPAKDTNGRGISRNGEPHFLSHGVWSAPGGGTWLVGEGGAILHRP